MIILRRIYTCYAFLVFCLSFLVLFPFLVICIWIPGIKKYGRKINRKWAKFYFTVIFLPIDIKGKRNIQKGQPYVFVANHFSYVDIPMMGFLPGDVVFVGKSSIRKIPVFGYYFKNLHIAVTRTSIKSRGEALYQAKKSLEDGSSVVIFPEAGITTNMAPHLSKFKDGAFSLAIAKQIPVIPVTLSYNHLILPEDGRLLLNFKRGKMVIHEPIPTESMASKDVPLLKETCFKIIQDQLWQDNEVLAAEGQRLNTI
jgi:1-acyl-sn-glycerol-3-phosphate acyltransferase